MELVRVLEALPGAERERHVASLVHEHSLAVLPSAPRSLDTRLPFTELGFDSLAAVDLQARLSDATGLALPATLVFDHPTPAALARHLTGLLLPGRTAPDAGHDGHEGVGTPDDDPVAVVGIGCRYPGGVASADDLWRLVADAGHVLTDFPDDRGWDLEGLYDPDPANPGTTYVRKGGFLPDAAEFDAGFFGIGPREASATDPQQRLILQTSWHALEHAGIDPAGLRGARAGVFIGAEAQEYGPRLHEAPAGLDGYLLTGNAPSVISGRVAYALGLEGPTLTVDTACSGSLVALHLAGRALRAGECSLALAGGVAVMSGPGVFTAFSRQRGLAPDGRCKAFAASADGTGFAEGVGVLVLERLSDARRNGHRVLALLRGSAVNSDGASNGLTAPSGPAQERVIRSALADAGLDPRQIDAVEAHGTGTRLGDPIEARALLAAYGQHRPAEHPLWLGSVKSNIGHAQAAAGAAGVIKMIMAMRHGTLPKTLHVDERTPHVDWSLGGVELLTEARPWESGDEPRRAGVSSFGVSGTNAHVIVEEAPAEQATEPTPDARPGAPLPLPLSGRTEQALRDRATALLHGPLSPPAERDEDRAGALADLGRALATTRAVHEERALVIAADHAEAARGLAELAAGRTAPGVLRGTAGTGRLAFLFPGQGAQRLGMGRALYRAFPVYARTFDEVCAFTDLQLDRPLREVVLGDDARALDRTAYAQPALFAVEVALYRLLESFGVTPDLLLGHSVGEFAAAHAAGVMSLEDAAFLVAARGRLMDALPEGGAMAAVAATEDEIRPLLTDDVSLAAVNGASSVVVSGTADAVRAVAGQFARSTPLRVSHAFHSALMEPMLDEFRRAAEVVDYAPPRIPVVSDVTGRTATAEELRSPEYWVRHVRETVRFHDGVQELAEQGALTYLELGPDAVLSALASDCVPGDGAAFASVLRRDADDERQLLTALATAHVRGASVDWPALFESRGSAAAPVELPGYPFQTRRHWLTPPAAADAARLGQEVPGHPLLGAALTLADATGTVLTGRLSLDSHPWLADHAISGTVLLPGTALLELAVGAGDRVGCRHVEEFTLESPLALPEHGGTAVQVVLRETGAPRRWAVELYARAGDAAPEDPWHRHASGTLAPAAE
ncbi:type I polyketide synthase, partial [Streptomyces ardesiacus]